MRGIREVSEVETGESGTQKTATYNEAKKLLDEAWARSAKVYKEAKDRKSVV